MYWKDFDEWYDRKVEEIRLNLPNPNNPKGLDILSCIIILDELYNIPQFNGVCYEDESLYPSCHIIRFKKVNINGIMYWKITS